tara:strand:+ start:319 stop:1020 length:702 start_codon:yes stop_codon:yes gene_type:complete
MVDYKKKYLKYKAKYLQLKQNNLQKGGMEFFTSLANTTVNAFNEMTRPPTEIEKIEKEIENIENELNQINNDIKSTKNKKSFINDTSTSHWYIDVQADVDARITDDRRRKAVADKAQLKKKSDIESQETKLKELERTKEIKLQRLKNLNDTKKIEKLKNLLITIKKILESKWDECDDYSPYGGYDYIISRVNPGQLLATHLDSIKVIDFSIKNWKENIIRWKNMPQANMDELD